ncbi:hypothetical protein [Ferruginibacter sp. HRS2-29]|uniref:hypothetical protein n=1 Tax=Ferruginibacter sp. HRS2-29 TaxID=2487334 RepID=UPI0020CF4CCD|nr:hypothetical protein [Ferruginibacter sp. HRS2-29]
MTKELKRQLDFLTRKATIIPSPSEKKGASRRAVRSSLHQIINTKEKADRFMKLLASIHQ